MAKSSILHQGMGGSRVAFARHLRSNSPDTEKRMWNLLRGRQLRDHKFRRQHPVGPHIADFCCMKKRLIIELDGGQHAEQIEKDRRRTLCLSSRGYRVIRFWDNEVLTQPEGVLERILEALEEGPSPSPLP